MPAAFLQSVAADGIQKLGGRAVVEHFRRLGRHVTELDFDGMALIRADPRRSALRANRCLGHVRTTSSNWAHVMRRRWRPAAASKSSTPTQPSRESSMPIDCGSCRSTKLRNLLMRLASSAFITIFSRHSQSRSLAPRVIHGFEVIRANGPLASQAGGSLAERVTYIKCIAADHVYAGAAKVVQCIGYVVRTKVYAPAGIFDNRGFEPETLGVERGELHAVVGR